MFKVTLVLLGAFAICYAGMAELSHEKKPDKFKDVKGCYIKEFDYVIPYGSRVSSRRSCLEYSCTEEYVYRYSCIEMKANPPCWVLRYMNFVERPYPECCPTIKC